MVDKVKILVQIYSMECIAALTAVIVIMTFIQDIDKKYELGEMLFLFLGIYLMSWGILQMLNMMIDSMFFKCYKILKIGYLSSLNGRKIWIRRRYLKKQKNRKAYMECLMDDMFKIIRYAKIKKIEKIYMKMNIHQLIAIIYSCSDSPMQVVKHLEQLQEFEEMEIDDFKIHRNENRLDCTMRYMYSIFPKKSEWWEISKQQKMFEMELCLTKSNVGQSINLGNVLVIKK